MKHLNALHARVNSPFALAQESIDTIAMEGMGEAFKAKWDLFKSKFRPDEAAQAKARLELYAKMKQDAQRLKTAISQARDGEQSFNVGLNAAAKKLPVNASDANSLIANLSALRRQIATEIKRITAIKDEAEASAARAKLQQQMKARGEVADKMVFTRQQALKFMDELVGWIEMAETVSQDAIKAHSQAKREGVATEHFALSLESMSMEDSIAMEGFWNKLVGYYWLYTGYSNLVSSVLHVVCAVCFAVMAAPGMAALMAAYAGVSWWLGNVFVRWGKARLDAEQEQNTEAPATPAQESIAMEGLSDVAKDVWDTIKAKFKPNDKEQAQKKLKALAKMKDDAIKLKGVFSTTKEAGDRSSDLSLSQMARDLPVDAQNADELIRNLGQVRSKASALVRKISTVKTEEEVKALSAEIDALLKKKGNIAEKMSFNRQQAIKLFDEIIGFIELEQQAVQGALDAQAKGANVAQEAFTAALESHSIAMEGFWNKFLGYYWLWSGMGNHVNAILMAFSAITLLFSGAAAFTPIYLAGAALNWWLGNVFIGWSRQRFAKDGLELKPVMLEKGSMEQRKAPLLQKTAQA